MNKWLLFLLLCLSSLPAVAFIETYQFDSAETEAEYNRLIQELRCLVCQNQNLAESDADLARDLRRETYEMLNAGKSADDVVEFMVARYGDFVLYRPPFKASTWLLWLGPVGLLAIVLFVVQRRVRGSAATPVDGKSLDAARKLLEENDDDDHDREDHDDNKKDQR